LDLQKSVTPQNAHVVRVRFDILRYVASRFHPSVYGERPASAPVPTVNVGVAISPERLVDLRSRLDGTRSALALKKKTSQWRHRNCSKVKSESALTALWSGTLTLYQRLACVRGRGQRGTL
jgi:hypothetical protein